MTAAPLRVAVIGLGAMGRHHARIAASTPGASLVATCDADLARAREHAPPEGCAALTDAGQLPAELDMAVIATPTSSHRAVAEPLLRRGVSCLVEKPIAATLEDADAMIAAAEAGGARLAIGHAERYNPALLALRDRIRRPLFVEAHRLGGFPERSLDVDVVLDLMIHDLDLLLWLAGGDIEDVRATGVAVLTQRIDIANARLTTTTGCTANLTVSRVSAEPTRKLRIFQEDAYISVDLMARTGEIVQLDRDVKPRPEIRRSPVEAPAAGTAPEPLRLEQEALAASIRDGRLSSGVTALEGRRALAAALRVLAALEDNRSWRSERLA